MQGAPVQPLGRELRFHVPHSQNMQSRVRILEYTTECSMEKGKPYLFTTENMSLKELGAQGWKVPRGKQYSPEIGGAGSHHHPKAGETKGRGKWSPRRLGHLVEARGKVSLPSRKLEPQLLQGADREGGKYPGSF